MRFAATEVLPEIVRNRLELLQQLGVVVDEAAAQWLSDQTGQFDQAALNSITEARRAIELTVDLALSHQVENHPALRALHLDWEQRFATIAAAIAKKQHALTQSSRQHSLKTRAAQAYIGNERLG